MNQETNCQCCGDPCSAMLHGAADLCVGRNDCKVQADITMDRAHGVVVWGIVTDCTGAPVPNALVRLLRYTGECGPELRELCRTCTDCQGYYQFDLERGCEGRYRVAVSSCPPCGERRAETCAPWDGCGGPCGQYGGPCGCRSAARNQIQYY